jgi:ABC-type multidrug transport system permease subunit
LIPALILVPGISEGNLGSWLTLIWVLVFGLVATLPLGAVLGSVFASVRSQGFLTLPILALVAISGIFYPITTMPNWVYWIAQISRSTGSASACDRLCCRRAGRASKTANHGGIGKPSERSAHGRCSA